MKTAGKVVGASVLGVVVFLFVFAYIGDERRNAELAETKSAERIAYLLLDYVHEDALSSVTTGEDGTLKVSYRIDPWASTLPFARVLFLDHAKDLVGRIFKQVDGVSGVELVALTEFVDLRGRADRADALRIAFGRETAEPINWDKVAAESLPRVADAFWVHPATEFVPREPAQSESGVEWFEGGTLHKADLREWTNADYRNRLATAADFFAGAAKSDNRVPTDSRDRFLAVVRIGAEKLEQCVAGVANESKTADALATDVTQIAAACYTLMYAK